MTTAEAQVRKYYDAAGPAYHELMGTIWHHGDLEAEQAGLSPEEAGKAVARKQLAAAGLKAGETALDFGAGVGGTTIYMAEVSGARFVGVQNNEWLSAKAREHAAEKGVSEQVQFATIGDEDYKTLIAWPDNSLSMISFYESVCHLPSKEAFFHAAYRVLKPGAYLVGLDWVKRPFGEYQTDEQMEQWTRPIEEVISIPWLGTVDQYHKMISAAGFDVEVAEDLFPGVQCWGSTPPNDGQGWGSYGSPVIRDGKRVLDAARSAGVFSVGRWVARKPA